MSSIQTIRPFACLLQLMSLWMLCSPSEAYADKGKKVKADFSYAYELPVPDELPAPSRPEEHVFPHREVMLVVVSTASEKRGIDVSHYQGRINWELVATDREVNFVYIKATESVSLVDDCYQYNLEGARRVGLPVGAYHFFSPSTSAYTQFMNFSRTVDPQTQDLIPIVDVEKRGRNSLPVFISQIRIFLNEVEKLYGVKPLIYTGVNFYNKYLQGEFLDYKFMIARYVEDPPELCEEVRMVLWQYTSQGSVQGIRGHVDQSCFMGNYSLEDIKLRPSRRR